jgi:hypothetical protein
MVANDKQVGGHHYKRYGDLQPWDVVLQWKLGYLEGTALKYIARWRDKGGIDDIKKAIHFLEKLVEVNSPRSNSVPNLASKPISPETLRPAMGFYSPSAMVEQCRNTYDTDVGGASSLSQWGLHG